MTGRQTCRGTSKDALKRDNSKALYVHCGTHLVSSKAVDKSSCMKELINYVDQLSKFYKKPRKFKQLH